MSNFREIVERRLKELGQNKYRAALRAGLPSDAIRSVLDGRTPSLARAQEICEALGIEFHVGPKRSVAPEISRALGLDGDCGVEDAVKAIERSKQWASDSLSAIRAEMEANVETFRRDTTRQWVEILQEYQRVDPDHLQNAPFHAIPFATQLRPTGRPEEVEFLLAPVGLSLRRVAIPGWAEWKHLVCIRAPSAGSKPQANEGDLIVLDTMRPTTRQGDLLVLDVSNPELLRGFDPPYLILSGEGLSLRRLVWVADSRAWYSELAESATRDGQTCPREQLSPGDWVLGRIARTIPGGLPFADSGGK